ncbi:GntR family transcriptional regulator [Litorihabitans aurantiacus]|nr:GntR family transcriptional regulator [Litorihabitans aurantiacus]
MDTTPNTTTDADRPARRIPARQRVYEELLTELLTTNVSPFHRFTEENTAERFGASRTPVRDALLRLEADGVLVRRDGALYRYVPSAREFFELYELRVTLETAGLDRALADPTVRHDRAALEAELAVWEERRESTPDPSPRFVLADEQFHVSLLGAAGNSEATRALERVNRRIRPVRMHDYLTPDRMEATVAEHLDILEHVLRGDVAGARELLTWHVGQSQLVVHARAAAVTPFGPSGEDR